MTYIFKNLGENTTFEEFRNEYEKKFGDDYFEFTDKEDVPSGRIGDSNNEFIKINNDGYVELWIDEADDSIVEI